MSKGWIGVDLDGTLAEYHGWTGGIGAPVPRMVERVKSWLANGEDVRIVTARVSPFGGRSSESGEEAANVAFLLDQERQIRAWCLEHLGTALPVTYAKDFAMFELWDDRAIQVIPNTGDRADGVEA